MDEIIKKLEIAFRCAKYAKINAENTNADTNTLMLIKTAATAAEDAWFVSREIIEAIKKENEALKEKLLTESAIKELSELVLKLIRFEVHLDAYNLESWR